MEPGQMKLQGFDPLGFYVGAEGRLTEREGACKQFENPCSSKVNSLTRKYGGLVFLKEESLGIGIVPSGFRHSAVSPFPAILGSWF